MHTSFPRVLWQLITLHDGSHGVPVVARVRMFPVSECSTLGHDVTLHTSSVVFGFLSAFWRALAQVCAAVHDFLH